MKQRVSRGEMQDSIPKYFRIACVKHIISTCYQSLSLRTPPEMLHVTQYMITHFFVLA